MIVRVLCIITKKNFAVLDVLVHVNRFDSYPLCFCSIEPIDAQRIDCPGCGTMDESERKDRICENVKLVSCTINIYKYSSGYRLEFNQKSTEKKDCC